ncbi:probable 3-deoxy-D-manno-octulosonic acid transferase, mitochondrial [Aristolochia californica]|uniref:probable 3-deoxy-D-manno-octulosonic acid transferase, mitochondrial n=1 Tax=Aristolochia californica TaxID=171875 RepID=UPI0035D73492
MTGGKGQVVFAIYSALTSGLSPFLFLHLQWRRFRGLEHPVRWRERFGHPSCPRPPGPLVWFHAVSLGEGMAAIPIIKHCVQKQPNVTILMTTTTVSAFEVIKDKLPNGVIYQFAPIDVPASVDAFLVYWNPIAVFLMESELWPNLVLSASKKGIAVALLNARVSTKSFKLWSGPVGLPLISLMLSKISLIAPLSTLQGIHFQLLQASPSVVHFAGDLKYAIGEVDVSEMEVKKVRDLQLLLSHRQIWMASSLHMGEEQVMIWVHKALLQMYPDMVSIIVPRHPQDGQHMALVIRNAGLNVVMRSHGQKILPSTNFYIVDTLGELRSLYSLSPIAVIGGSFIPGLAGHNISEAAASGCAVLTGPHVGHFSHMVLGMQRVNPMSVQQVPGKEKLLEALKVLIADAEALEMHRVAAREAFLALSSGVVENIWKLINAHVFKQAFRDSQGFDSRNKL